MLQRTLVFVDTSYLLASFYNSWATGARSQLSIDLPEVVRMLGSMIENQLGQQVQKQLWYDGIPESGPHRYQRALRGCDGVQLRAGQLIEWGDRRTQKAVDTRLVADMVVAACRQQVSDIVLVSGDADMIPGVDEATSAGLRVHLYGFGWDSMASALRHACDTTTILDPREDFGECMELQVLEGPLPPTVHQPDPTVDEQPLGEMEPLEQPGLTRVPNAGQVGFEAEFGAGVGAGVGAGSAETSAGGPHGAPDVTSADAPSEVKVETQRRPEPGAPSRPPASPSTAVRSAPVKRATDYLDAKDFREVVGDDAQVPPVDEDELGEKVAAREAEKLQNSVTTVTAASVESVTAVSADGVVAKRTSATVESVTEVSAAEPGEASASGSSAGAAAPKPAPSPAMMAPRRKLRSRYVPLPNEVWASAGFPTPFSVGEQYAIWWYANAASDQQKDEAHLLTGGGLPPEVDRPLLQFACESLHEYTLTENQRVALRDGFHHGIRAILLQN